jgi:hypothetical protein
MHYLVYIRYLWSRRVVESRPVCLDLNLKENCWAGVLLIYVLTFKTQYSAFNIVLFIEIIMQRTILVYISALHVLMYTNAVLLPKLLKVITNYWSVYN